MIDGKPIACRPRKAGRYIVYYADTQTEEPLTPDIAARIAHKAFSIGRALPSKPLSQKDVRQFVYRNLRGRDIALILILGLTVTLIGLLLPTMAANSLENVTVKKKNFILNKPVSGWIRKDGRVQL